MLTARIRCFIFAAVAGALLLCVLVGTSSGGPDKPEELRKEVKAAIESQFTGFSVVTYKYYMPAATYDEAYCVPKGMKVPEIFRNKAVDLLKEPHKQRYKVVKVEKNYRTSCYGLRIQTRFHSCEILTVSLETAWALVNGLACLSALVQEVRQEGKLPEGYKEFAKRRCFAQDLSENPRDPYVHALASLTRTERPYVSDFAPAWKFVWKGSPEDGKKILEKILSKSKKGLEELTKKSQVVEAFQKAKDGEDTGKIYEQLKKDRGELNVLAEYSPDAGLLTETWFKHKSMIYNANAIADVTCLVELKYDSDAKEWKVKKTWLLSELEIPKKVK